VVVPDDDLVSLICVDQHDHIRFVHHFNDAHLALQFLDFLLQPFVAGVVLEDFKSSFRSNGEVLLRLVSRDAVDLDWCRLCLPTLLLHECVVCVSQGVDVVKLNDSLLSRHEGPLWFRLRFVSFH